MSKVSDYIKSLTVAEIKDLCHKRVRITDYVETYCTLPAGHKGPCPKPEKPDTRTFRERAEELFGIKKKEEKE